MKRPILFQFVAIVHHPRSTLPAVINMDLLFICRHLPVSGEVSRRSRLDRLFDDGPPAWDPRPAGSDGLRIPSCRLRSLVRSHSRFSTILPHNVTTARLPHRRNLSISHCNNARAIGAEQPTRGYLDQVTSMTQKAGDVVPPLLPTAHPMPNPSGTAAHNVREMRFHHIMM
jgi:hypothetical protein